MKKIYTYEQIQEILKEVGLKSTSQRMLIMEAFNILNHPTAEELYAHVYQSLPGISLGTVYKTLDTLVKHKIITKIQSESGTFRFDSNTRSHNHIYCTNTNEIIDFEDADLKKLLDKYFEEKKPENIKIQDIRLQIFAERTSG